MSLREEKLDCRFVFRGEVIDAVAHLFRFDRDDMHFRFGRVDVSGTTDMSSLILQNHVELHFEGKRRSAEQLEEQIGWTVKFIRVWARATKEEPIATMHADFVVLGCDEYA